MNFARVDIETNDYSIIGATPEQIADNDRCLDIIALARVTPDERCVRRAHLRRSDIAPRFEAHRPHGPKTAVTAGEDHEVTSPHG